jgi:hypothetical protein
VEVVVDGAAVAVLVVAAAVVVVVAEESVGVLAVVDGAAVLGLGDVAGWSVTVGVLFGESPAQAARRAAATAVVTSRLTARRQGFRTRAARRGRDGSGRG